MAKAKASKSAGSNVPHKHLHSRLSFLHQAASFLAQSKARKSPERLHGQEATSDHQHHVTGPVNSTETARLLGHLHGVSRKSQIRLAPAMKHSICKRCDELLIPGRTSSGLVVNPSKNGRKPWADLFEVRCHKCGAIKRFPVGKGKGEEKGGQVKFERETESETKLSHTQGANPTT